MQMARGSGLVAPDMYVIMTSASCITGFMVSLFLSSYHGFDPLEACQHFPKNNLITGSMVVFVDIKPLREL